MYKNLAVIGLFVLMLFGGTVTPCEALHHIEDVDGVACYNGDANLPFYSMGSGGGCVAERNSAVLVNESQQTAVVDFYGFIVEFQRGANHPIEPPEESGFRTHRFVYHKDTNEFAVIEGSGQWKVDEFGAKALRLVYESAKSAELEKKKAE